MNPAKAKSALTAALKSDVPVFLWGPPGAGKSSVVRQAATEFAVPVVDIRAAQLDPVDLRGIPNVTEGRTHWNPPAILDIGKPAFLFLDELPQAPQLVQSALFQLVLDRCVGELKLHPGVRIIAAGNRTQDRSATNRMPAALANRFVHIEVEAHLESWVAWAAGAGVEPELIAFLQHRPDLLSAFNPEARENPTPRTWEFVDRLLKKASDSAIIPELISGAVGAGAAVEFMAFRRMFGALVTLDEILADPVGAKIPTKADELFAVSALLAARTTEKNAKPAFTYIRRLPQEFQAACVTQMIKRTPDIQKAPAFISWSST